MTQARKTRLQRGMTPEAMAKRLRVSVGYLLMCERLGFPYSLARRAERVYSCPIDYFLREAKTSVVDKRGAGRR